MNSNILQTALPTCNSKIIDQQYLGDSLSLALEIHKLLIVQSGMGTGKTCAMIKMLNNLAPDHGAMIEGPRTKLLQATASQLGFCFYEDLKKETDPVIRAKMALRICVTPQSAPAVLAEFPDIHYKLLVIDESETHAAMLVSPVTHNKEAALDTLKAIALQADHVVLMDAHAGKKTEALMKILSNNEPVHTLINTFKPWSVIDATIIEGGHYAARVRIIDGLQIEAIEHNKKIGICTSSKKYAKQRKKVFKTLYPRLRVLLLTSDNADEIAYILKHPETLIEWDVVIFSPAVSVGVSFDVADHIDQVFGVFPNTPYTGDTDDALQALARIRKPSDGQWIICLDDNKPMFKHLPTCPDDIAIAIGQREYRIRHNLQADAPNDTELQLIDLFAVCDYERVHRKNNFDRLFRQRLQQMGVTVHRLAIDNLTENTRSNETTEVVEAEAIEADFINRTESLPITADQAQALITQQQHKPWQLSEAEVNSLARFEAERDLMINFDEQSDDQKRAYIALLDNGAIAQCVHHEIALAPRDFTRQYMIACRQGIGDNHAFKVDLLDAAFNYPLMKKLLSYAVPYFDGQEYTHKTLKGSPLIQFVQRHLNEIKALQILALPHHWRTKPALLMKHLLRLCGYTHTYRRDGRGKHRQQVFKAVSNPLLLQLIQSRHAQGKDWITVTRQLIASTPSIATLKPTVISTASEEYDINHLIARDVISEAIIGYSIDEASQQQFYTTLATLPVSVRQQVIRDYILIATLLPDPTTQLTPLALAKVSLINAEKEDQQKEQNPLNLSAPLALKNVTYKSSGKIP